MNINIEVRKRQLQSLDQYINSSKKRLQSLISQLGWNAKQISEKPDHIACPIIPGHKIPLANIDKHVGKCCLKSSGYDLEDKFLSEPNSNPSTSSISLDTQKKIEVLNTARNGKPLFKTAWNGVEPDPQTCDRLVTTFSTDERLALYDYSVQNTEAPPVLNEFLVDVDDKVEEKDLTPQEILQKERNAKRRRVKYKTVHTGRNKSYTEVVREVINNQMELYQEYIVNQAPQVEVPQEHTDINGGEMHIETYTQIPFMEEIVDKTDKTINDKVSTIESSHGQYSERDDYSERDRQKERRHKEPSRRREDDRDRYKSRRRSRDRESHHSRKRNGNHRHHESYRRSDRERRH